MEVHTIGAISVKQHIIKSTYLKRKVTIDFYFSQPPVDEEVSLLLINDGQDLKTMNFQDILENLYSAEKIQPMLFAAIHCGPDRRNEYGTANVLDYTGRGVKAKAYTHFIFLELLPFIRTTFKISSFRQKSFCGFSLGGLSALDIVWNHPHEFSKVGVFSGSLWWRTVDQDDPEFDENLHRIMHNQVREGSYYSWLRFFFQTGTSDETADRNNNGIIDVIDDTLSLIEELIKKGYTPDDFKYIELADGKHDVRTWGRAFPEFLTWAFSK
ncbi:hypothetical protein BH09BAC2_BH09BAC2_15350 [soil metagenome]